MDEKIFVKETEEGSSPKVILLVGGLLIVLLVAAGLYLVLSGSDSEESEEDTGSNQEQIEDENPAEDSNLNTDTDTETNEETSPEPLEEPLESDTPPTSGQPDNAQSTELTQPQDASVVNIYFKRNDGSLAALTREAPSDTTGTNLETFMIIQVLEGPSRTEQAEGFLNTWTFSGSSQCETTSGTFTYEVSAGDFIITMCKANTGSDISNFVESIIATISSLDKYNEIIVQDAAGNRLS
ncbi:MAG: hypothetical protein ACOCXP_02155 [Candidatus Dojkabacteria bacterium]